MSNKQIIQETGLTMPASCPVAKAKSLAKELQRYNQTHALNAISAITQGHHFEVGEYHACFELIQDIIRQTHLTQLMIESVNKIKK